MLNVVTVFQIYSNLIIKLHNESQVLLPLLFANDIVVKINLSGFGCILCQICIDIILYVNDLVLVLPSLLDMHNLVHLCEDERNLVDMRINLYILCLRIDS